jgi:hypothetical protein
MKDLLQITYTYSVLRLKTLHFPMIKLSITFDVNFLTDTPTILLILYRVTNFDSSLLKVQTKFYRVISCCRQLKFSSMVHCLELFSLWNMILTWLHHTASLFVSRMCSSNTEFVFKYKMYKIKFKCWHGFDIFFMIIYI